MKTKGKSANLVLMLDFRAKVDFGDGKQKSNEKVN